MLCLVAQSCLTLCDPMDYNLPGSSVHVDSTGKNTGVDCHALLQGIFPTQGMNPGLSHCRQILYHLSHQRSPSPCPGYCKQCCNEHWDSCIRIVLCDYIPVAQMVKNLPAMWETWVQSPGWKYPLEKVMATHCSILAWIQRVVGWPRVGYNWATDTTILHR